VPPDVYNPEVIPEATRDELQTYVKKMTKILELWTAVDHFQPERGMA